VNTPEQPAADSGSAERLSQLEARMARVEEQLRQGGERAFPAAAPLIPSPAAPGAAEEELEFQVGQNWFAAAGIFVLAVGIIFSLARPYAGWPRAAPALIGYAAAAAFLLCARAWRRTFELGASGLRASAMALAYFATLRLYFFGAHPVLSTGSIMGPFLLLAVAAANLVFALRSDSPALVVLALGTGYIAALAVGTAGFVLACLPVLSLVAVVASLRRGWPALRLVAAMLTFTAYGLWAINQPYLGRPLHLAVGPTACLGVLLACAVIFAAGSWRRRPEQPETALANLTELTVCGAAYGGFLIHSLASFGSVFVAAHAAASATFLGLAMASWLTSRSRVATFLYAMTGYLALSFAIVRAAPGPPVFMWLSLQSLVVVTTAIWFRSRLIVVANFFIFLAIVATSMAVARQESGICLAFGVVALATARLLAWQQDRLELKTELMRNAYLISALVVFPYALYHLVAAAYVALARVGLALFYYLMNLVVQSRKYRWMGHFTLLFTVLYLLVGGLNRLDPGPRNLSFLVLGAVLVAVSLVFARVRRRRSGPSRI
jgi:hypothetical protein